MNKLHLFNPENDFALAMRGKRFTMSPQVAGLHRAGALLPIWWCEPGDAILAEEHDERWLSAMCRLFGMEQPRVVTSVDVAEGAFEGSPWGWSSDAARQFVDAGVKPLSEAAIADYARLSHRRTGVAVMERLHKSLGGSVKLPPVPEEVASIDRFRCLMAQWGRCYVKAPWSSSGRGVFPVSSLGEHGVVGRIKAIIRQQGSVMVEPALDKKRDFATLFRCNHGQVARMGYSLFFNAMESVYGGNILASNERIEQMLADDGVDIAVLRRIIDELHRALTDLVAPVYDGWLGVDMLVCRDGMIAPCVEVNLRMTMGVLARLFVDRFMAPGAEGVFRVTQGVPAGDSGELPIVNANHKMTRGRLFLTPPCNEFNFVVTVGSDE